ncbi:neocarzinostatin apoprotein domain-containing protein [Nocardia sp. CDC153]|uniref:neocarzinostatin apoprotein domain-containing protein n=1 Tax=Nocardia sp. CDC153 TaxID=3112167 RepID=UPI002DBF3ECA|nr:neocarzinostatin apoprotein domain-containing protein [Nocardia sp. CDC153]MEC3957748.1 neocarzinostatin apoprotein domain-containing protein [Nocardia sp. CDC153]
MGPPVLLIAVAAAGPAAGIEIALLGKPLGGTTGLPGVVVGYIGLTAVVLGCVAILPARRWRLLSSGRRIGVAGLVAGAGLLVAGLVPTAWGLTLGVLVTGAMAGPLLVSALAEASPRGFHGFMSVGALAGAVAASVCFEHPGIALVAVGAVAAAAGAVYAALNPVPRAGFDGGLRHCVRLLRWELIRYGAIGFVTGGTVLPALHLLLFRWSVLDADQSARLAMALVPTIVVALLGYRRATASAPLLILAAGGPMLVATAPGAWQTVVGVAVALTAGVRVVAVADSWSRQQISDSERWTAAAVTGLALGFGGGCGLGVVVGLSRAWGTGTALTVLAIPVLVIALCVTRLLSRGRAVLALTAAGVVAPAGIAMADPGQPAALHVSATTDLTEGQRVTVYGTDFQPGLSAVAVGLCKQGFTNGLKDCDLDGGATFVNIDGEGRFKTLTLTLHPRFKEIDCTRQQCVVAAAPLPGTEPSAVIAANSAAVTMSFVGAHLTPATTPPPLTSATAAPADTRGPSTALWSVTAGLLVIVAAIALADRRRQ